MIPLGVSLPREHGVLEVQRRVDVLARRTGARLEKTLLEIV